MKIRGIFLSSVCVILVLFVSKASADEEGKIKEVIRTLYSQDEKSLQCRQKDGSVDNKLIKVPKKFFSSDFMARYQSLCFAETDFFISFDIRTAENNIYLFKDSKASVSNLRIGPPSIRGRRAVVTATYDLDEFSFKDWGNFSKLKMVKQGENWKIDDIELGGKGEDRESITSLRSITSLKKYIDENVKKSRKGRAE